MNIGVRSAPTHFVVWMRGICTQLNAPFLPSVLPHKRLCSDVVVVLGQCLSVHLEGQQHIPPRVHGLDHGHRGTVVLVRDVLVQTYVTDRQPQTEADEGLLNPWLRVQKDEIGSTRQSPGASLAVYFSE